MNRHRTRVLGDRTLAPETLMMGYGYDPTLSEGAIKAPLFQSSTFVFKSAEDGKRFFEVAYGLRQRDPDEALGLIYSRINNPNLEILEDRLAVWDKADKALVFSTGMAAISTAMLALVRPGDVILYTAPAYGGTPADDSVRQAASSTLAFGPQTWPHALARAMLAEQLYRAVTILSGWPYHRD